MSDTEGAGAIVGPINIDQQVKVSHKLPFKFEYLEDGVVVPTDDESLFTLSDDTPATVEANPDGGHYFVPSDDAAGAIVQLRAKFGAGPDALFESVTIEILAADVVPPPRPVTRTIRFVFGEPVLK